MSFTYEACLCACHSCASARGEQKKVMDPLGMELQIMGHPLWVLGTKFKSFMQNDKGLPISPTQNQFLC